MKNVEFYYGKSGNYSKYRPIYPKSLFEILQDKYNLSKDSIVVELGAGTGKFSKLISNYAAQIYSVEPNDDMITECKEYCKENNNISYIKTFAEDTGLLSKSADFVFAVQSFHWFEKEKAKNEVKRILKPNGLFAIIWNNLEDEKNKFSKEYIKYINNWRLKITNEPYQHKNIKEREEFFLNEKYEKYDIIHSKKYDINMLIGLSKSLSFVPKEENKEYKEILKGIKEIFYKYEDDGYVTFDFHTEMYIGMV